MLSCMDQARVGGPGGAMSHLSEVMERCHLLPIPVPAGATEAAPGAHPAPLGDAAKCRIPAGVKPVGRGGTGRGSPDFKRGEGITMPSLWLLIYDRSDTLCAVARGSMRLSLSQ